MEKQASKMSRLERRGIDESIPVKLKSLWAPSYWKQVTRKGVRGKKYIPLLEIIIDWQPTTPPEIPGYIMYEMYYDQSTAGYTILKGMFRLGHPVTISMSTTILIDEGQIKENPYKVKVTPMSDIEGFLGNIGMTVKYGSPVKYRQERQRIISIAATPSEVNNLPSTFYIINPGGDGEHNSVDILHPIIRSCQNDYSTWMREFMGVPQPDVSDYLVLRYIMTEQDSEKVHDIIYNSDRDASLTDEQAIFLGNFKTRYSQSNYRKYISDVMVRLCGEKPKNAYARF